MEDAHFIADDFRALVQATSAEAKGSRNSIFDRPSSYFGLFDGHAGRAAAEYCRSHLHHNIVKCFRESHDICDAMTRGFVMLVILLWCNLYLTYYVWWPFRFLLTDEHFIADAQKDNEESGSVAVSMIVSESRIYVAHAGDARAVLCRGGTAMLLTQDHKPTL